MDPERGGGTDGVVIYTVTDQPCTSKTSNGVSVGGQGDPIEGSETFDATDEPIIDEFAGIDLQVVGIGFHVMYVGADLGHIPILVDEIDLEDTRLNDGPENNEVGAPTFGAEGVRHRGLNRVKAMRRLVQTQNTDSDVGE